MTVRTDPWSRCAHLWPLLAITRLPGTARPWRPRELTAEQAGQRDAQLRAERHMAEIFLGAAAAPLHLDILDVLVDLHDRITAAAISLGGEPGSVRILMPTWVTDPAPLLEWCREHVRHPGTPTADTLAADNAAWQILHILETALGEVYDGQQLQADCPWCHGGIARKPSWYVRLLPAGRDPKTGEPQRMPAIVCESGACQPPEREAGTWWRGQPAWPLWEWEWLAVRVEADSRRAS